MKRTLAFTLCVATVCVAALAAETRGSGAKTLSYERYGILAERNIYMKDRTPRRVTSILRDIPAEVIPPERTMVLTGIVRRGVEYVAFFEDTKSGTTIRARRGDALLQGRVGTISLDNIEYLRNGAACMIGVGENLEASLSMPGAVTAPATIRTILLPRASKPETTQPATAGNISSDEVSILEQLRQRRLQENGGT